MAVYARGAVSYGAAISALVATMGDACWVLLAADPVLTLELKVLMVTTGTVTGYAVDVLGIAPRLRGALAHSTTTHADETNDATVWGAAPKVTPPAIASRTALSEGPAIPSTSGTAALAWHDLGLAPTVLWALLAGGFLLSLPVTFHLIDPAALGAALLGDVDPYIALGVVGTTLCLIMFATTKGKVADDDTESAHPSSMTQVLRHGGHEVAFVTVWVAAAYLSWSLLTHLTGFDPSQLPLWGFAGVLMGAVVGLVPGCAIQIIFAGIFLAGGMPLPTLIANTVSQDGDALIPLLALEHRSAFLATVLTTVPALVVGTALLLLT
jgi:hypothetical protein